MVSRKSRDHDLAMQWAKLKPTAQCFKACAPTASFLQLRYDLTCKYPSTVRWSKAYGDAGDLIVGIRRGVRTARGLPTFQIIFKLTPNNTRAPVLADNTQGPDCEDNKSWDHGDLFCIVGGVKKTSGCLCNGSYSNILETSMDRRSRGQSIHALFNLWNIICDSSKESKSVKYMHGLMF